MFEEFSSGYYLGRLYVEPYVGDHAVLDSDYHEYVNDELYADGGSEYPDAGEEASPEWETRAPDADAAADRGVPLVMKLGNTHFRVRGEGAVPSGTLAIPRDWLDEDPPRDEPREVLLAKREHAERLFDIGAV